jgi:hypothetical protein
MTNIDATNYLKTKYPLRHGYDRRPSGVRPSAIVIHTTNNKRKTPFASEAKFLYESPRVSSHFLVGKTEVDGVVRFLPDTFRAWHTGEAKKGWGNSETIGIEMHVSVGERPTDWQLLALTELVRDLMREWNIPHDRIDTHREIALPAKRKSDPEGWNDESFYHWRYALMLPLPPPDPWLAWGTMYPLPVEQRQYGISTLWFQHRAILKEARSFPWYPSGAQGIVIQVFQGGLIWCVDGQCQVKQFARVLS